MGKDDRRCQAIDPVTGESCQREAVGRAPRKDRDGTVDYPRFCQDHYDGRRVAGVVGALVPLD